MNVATVRRVQQMRPNVAAARNTLLFDAFLPVESALCLSLDKNNLGCDLVFIRDSSVDVTLHHQKSNHHSHRTHHLISDRKHWKQRRNDGEKKTKAHRQLSETEVCVRSFVRSFVCSFVRSISSHISRFAMRTSDHLQLFVKSCSDAPE